MSKTRFKDTPRELRIRLKCSCKLSNVGDVRFFHEKTDKGDQVLTATLGGDLETLDVTLFMDRIKKLASDSKT
jgi:hypothetical protein